MQHAWIDFYANFKLSERWEYNPEAGLRLLLNDERWSRYNIRNAFIFRLNKVVLLYSGFNVHDLDRNFATRDVELRPWQGMRISLPINPSINLSNMFRYEERFYFYRDQPVQYGERFRYELSSSIPLKRRSIHKSEFMYFPLSDEILVYMERGGKHKPISNRLCGGVGFHITKEVRMELAYTRQFSRGSNEDVFFGSDNFYRFKLKYRPVKNG